MLHSFGSCGAAAPEPPVREADTFVTESRNLGHKGKSAALRAGRLWREPPHMESIPAKLCGIGRDAGAPGQTGQTRSRQLAYRITRLQAGRLFGWRFRPAFG